MILKFRFLCPFERSNPSTLFYAASLLLAKADAGINIVHSSAYSATPAYYYTPLQYHVLCRKFALLAEADAGINIVHSSACSATPAYYFMPLQYHVLCRKFALLAEADAGINIVHSSAYSATPAYFGCRLYLIHFAMFQVERSCVFCCRLISLEAVRLYRLFWRHLPDLDRSVRVLQTLALPLG